MNCPHCGSPNTLKKGYDRYFRQRYRCKECHKGFGGGDKLKPIKTLHYHALVDLCPPAKQSKSPTFTTLSDKVTCRICRKHLDNRVNPDDLTTNKSFSLTRKAIKLLVASSKVKDVSQSALVNQLILEHLSNS
jgi:hypothetical protein